MSGQQRWWHLYAVEVESTLAHVGDGSELVGFGVFHKLVGPVRRRQRPEERVDRLPPGLGGKTTVLDYIGSWTRKPTEREVDTAVAHKFAIARGADGQPRDSFLEVSWDVPDDEEMEASNE